MILQFNSYIKKIETTADKGLRLKIETQELSPDDKAKLFDLQEQYLWCVLKQYEKGAIMEEDIDVAEIATEFKTDKSPSQRLRAVIFVYWEKNIKGKEDWDVFYKRQMNKIIEKIKDNLD